MNMVKIEEVEIVQTAVHKEFCCERREKNKPVAVLGDESKKDIF